MHAQQNDRGQHSDRTGASIWPNLGKSQSSELVARPGQIKSAITKCLRDIIGVYCRRLRLISRSRRLGASHLGGLGALGLQNISVRLIARITKQLTTPAQAAALPLNSTLYHPRPKAAIAAIKTRIVTRRILMNGQSVPSPPTMPDQGLFDYNPKIQTEALPIAPSY